MREPTESEWDNHFKHGRRLRSPRAIGWTADGRRGPVTLWKCMCGRRYRGDVALAAHSKRATAMGCGFAVGVSRLTSVREGSGDD